jgi:hypothetical protein
MATIHHNTLKRAVSMGAVVEQASDGTFVASKGSIAVSANTAKDALDLLALELKPAKKAVKKPAKAKVRKPRDDEEDDGEGDEGEDEATDDEEAEDEEGDKSVVKAKYRQRYQPHKMTNGDDLAQRVRKNFMTLKGEDGKPRLDWSRFIKFAKANECWVEAYAKLNPGMQRMNVINKLRARRRNGEKVIWPA